MYVFGSYKIAEMIFYNYLKLCLNMPPAQTNVVCWTNFDFEMVEMVEMEEPLTVYIA